MMRSRQQAGRVLADSLGVSITSLAGGWIILDRD